MPEVWSYPTALLFSLASELQGLSPGSVGTSLGFRHSRLGAVVCLLPIHKQSEQTVLTHSAVLRMMKNLGVKSHVILMERNPCSGVSLNFKQVFSVSAGLSPAALP